MGETIKLEIWGHFPNFLGTMYANFQELWAKLPNKFTFMAVKSANFV